MYTPNLKEPTLVNGRWSIVRMDDDADFDAVDIIYCHASANSVE
jgi:hypothetical protein